MRKIAILLLFICSSLMAQTHVEYISEKTDSMALISKDDIDIINNVFSERNTLDSLYSVNEKIIKVLEEENIILDSIIVKQMQTIDNDKLIIEELENKNIETITTYTKELQKEKNKKISFQALTGAGIVAIILILLL